MVVAEGIGRPEVLSRRRVELADPAGRVRRNVYQSARSLDLLEAAAQVEAAERIAVEQAEAAFDETLSEAGNRGAVVQSCAVVVGAFAAGVRLESILRSHALAHAAEGRLYQDALLAGAETRGLQTISIPKKSIWEEGEAALGVARVELRERIDALRRQLGPPWAQDQKLAALAAWITLARSS